MKAQSINEIKKEKEQSLMETIAWRAGYYRANPQRFVSECLGISLKWFQKILIWAMMHYNFIMYLAARGQGKTYLTALFCCVRCILYPGSKIVVTSKTLKQADEVLLKIQDDFMKNSYFLCNEIQSCHIGQNDSTIMFKNNSFIKTRTSTENSRSARANILIVDEFRMVDKKVLDAILRKFLTTPRQPAYLNKPEYSHLIERNKEIYMSSAWLKSSWAWKKAQTYTKLFFDSTKKYFICGLPYQISIREGLLSKEQLEDEMSEDDHDPILQQMEMECIWLGEETDGLFDYDILSKNRRIVHSLLPLKYYNDKNPVPKLRQTEKRILSVDVALMATTKKKKNDAACAMINSLIQEDSSTYKSNYIYVDTFEGLTTDELGLRVMRFFYKYHCTDLVLDTQGVGLGVYDFIIKDQYDPVTGDVYKALCCLNDEDMALRCKVKDANKVVWSVKASAKFNDYICTMLRNAINNGKINLLIDDVDADEEIRKVIKGYDKLSLTDKSELKKSYVQTTMTIIELIKLQHEIKDGKIKVKELSNMRKDRYSSMAYNNWCASQLELKLKPKTESTQSLIDKLVIKSANYRGYRR